MKTILFQGDSITDSSRNMNGEDLGLGYPLLVSASLGLDYPEKYRFINRGIGGNKSVDLYARIKRDIINLKPDYMSVLIGGNDVWHEIYSQNGVDTPKFEKILTMLFEEVLAALPNVKIMLFGPMVLKGWVTESTEEFPERWEQFLLGMADKAAAVKRVAEKFGFPFIPLQEKFEFAALQTNDPTYWMLDGVHPSPNGHELIKREWLRAFEELKGSE